MRVIFQNLDRSDLAIDATQERLGDLFEKFPKLNEHKVKVTLSMENSSHQPGPDSFSVRVLIQGTEFKNVRLEKSAPNLYLALAHVREHLLEVLSRNSDKNRIRERTKERRFRSQLERHTG